MGEKKKTAELLTVSENTSVIRDVDIRGMVHIIRNRQVILDYDLASLYRVETKRLNERVKRNHNRFPETFCFQLTKEEFENLRSQIATSSVDYGGRRYLPYAFTEQGIAMLSAVLRSDVAVEVSIQIMNTFVEMRRFMASNALLFDRVTSVELRQLEYQKQTNEKFNEVFSYISEHTEAGQKIFYDGQIYDAFSLMASIICRADKDITLIDGYVDVGTLNVLAKKKEEVAVHIHTYPQTKLTQKDIDVFNSQYPQLMVPYSRKFHDRFLILDQKDVYHIGASLKDAGLKCFAITKMQDPNIARELLSKL